MSPSEVLRAAARDYLPRDFCIFIGPFRLNVFALRNGSLFTDAAVCIGRVWMFWNWRLRAAARKEMGIE